jgi:uncharacterized protein (TIGR02001 family)
MKNGLFAVGIILVSASSAFAQGATSPFSLDGYVGLTSDMRDRGISLSDRDFTLNGSVGLFHDSGFFGGIDFAKVDLVNGADVRTELFAGYSLDKGDYVYDFTVELDSNHGAGSQYYPEFKAAVSRDFGLAFTRIGAAYAPSGRWSNPGGDSIYTYGDIEIPVPTMSALTLLAHLGHDMRGGAENIWDWSVGVSAFVGDVEFTVAYEKSTIDQDIGSGRVIFGGRFYF